MEREKYRKNHWNKLFISIITIIGVVVLCLYLKYCHSEKEMINSNVTISTAPLVISTNIKWCDSICKVVLDEIELRSVVKEDNYKTKISPEGLIMLSEKDTLIVDSLSYMKLREHIVVPENRIDSIYQSEGIQGLLSAYFDEMWFTPYCNDDNILSLSEQRYVIYVLLQHGLSVRRDCESGDIYINRSATLKN